MWQNTNKVTPKTASIRAQANIHPSAHRASHEAYRLTHRLRDQRPVKGETTLHLGL
jgi:hypothetical protein